MLQSALALRTDGEHTKKGRRELALFQMTMTFQTIEL
jgi:hypothetical protein